MDLWEKWGDLGRWGRGNCGGIVIYERRISYFFKMLKQDIQKKDGQQLRTEIQG